MSTETPTKTSPGSLQSVTAQDPGVALKYGQEGKVGRRSSMEPVPALSNTIAAPFLHLLHGYPGMKAQKDQVGLNQVKDAHFLHQASRTELSKLAYTYNPQMCCSATHHLLMET